MKRRGPGVQNQLQHGVFSRGGKKRKSSIGGETYAPGRKGDPQLYVVGKKVNHLKLIIFEGFGPNGLQIRIQRIILHRIAPVKTDFHDFCDSSYFCHFFRR